MENSPEILYTVIQKLCKRNLNFSKFDKKNPFFRQAEVIVKNHVCKNPRHSFTPSDKRLMTCDAKEKYKGINNKNKFYNNNQVVGCNTRYENSSIVGQCSTIQPNLLNEEDDDACKAVASVDPLKKLHCMASESFEPTDEDTFASEIVTEKWSAVPFFDAPPVNVEPEKPTEEPFEEPPQENPILQLFKGKVVPCLLTIFDSAKHNKNGDKPEKGRRMPTSASAESKKNNKTHGNNSKTGGKESPSRKRSARSTNKKKSKAQNDDKIIKKLKSENARAISSAKTTKPKSASKKKQPKMKHYNLASTALDESSKTNNSGVINILKQGLAKDEKKPKGIANLIFDLYDEKQKQQRQQQQQHHQQHHQQHSKRHSTKQSQQDSHNHKSKGRDKSCRNNNTTNDLTFVSSECNYWSTNTMFTTQMDPTRLPLSFNQHATSRNSIIQQIFNTTFMEDYHTGEQFRGFHTVANSELYNNNTKAPLKKKSR